MQPVTQPPGRVTIKDIADRLGISKATVSRALLQRARVAPETRERVQAVARELGYRPDPTLRALSNLRWTQHPESRTTYRIALLNLTDRPKTGAGATDEAHQGAIDRAAELGLQLEEFMVDKAKELRRFGDVLYHRGYDGVLFGVRGPVQEWHFPYDRFPCLSISFDNPVQRLHQVTSDWFNAVSVAIDAVLARGYTRPGFVHFGRGNPSIDQRTWAAMLSRRAECAARFGSAPAIFSYAAEESGDSDALYQKHYPEFVDWVKAERPDVVIDGGFLAYWWLRDAGLRMPEDVSLLRLRRLCRVSDAHISAVDHNLHEQGRWAVDLLYNLIQTGSCGLPEHPVRITVACRLHAGETLRPLPATAKPAPVPR